MITITPHGTFAKGFTVEGHAEYAEHGRDIVCASVSAITQMIAYELVQSGSATYQIESGKLSVNINIERDIKYISRILTMMLRALRDIEAQYPKNIQIKEEY